MAHEQISLTGYRFSVYTRSVRLVLFEKGLDCAYSEVDPFDPGDAARLSDLHPFRRVPIVTHAGRSFYETTAILRYLDAAFPDPPLTPVSTLAAARMQQVIGIVDSYAYPVLIRNVFSNAVFRPLQGLSGDPAALRDGLSESCAVLRALDDIAAEGEVLNRRFVTLADFHLIPMIDYFRLVPEGAALLADQPALSAWWNGVKGRPSTIVTRPDLNAV